MRRAFVLSFGGFPVLLVVMLSCGRDPASVGDRTGSVAITMAFPREAQSTGVSHVPEALPVDSLSVEVSGSDMDAVRIVVPVVNNEASGTIEGIRVGRNRLVTALAWSAEPRVNLYRGDTTVAIEAGKTTEAVLVMARLQPGPVAHVRAIPDTAVAGLDVVADASASFDPYDPDSLLVFRFTLGGDEIRGWSSASYATFSAPGRGVWSLGVEARSAAGALGAASCPLHVLNTPPGPPILPWPSPGDTIRSLTPCLRWQSSDPDGDVLSFTVWYGSDSSSVMDEGSPAVSAESATDSVTVTGLQAQTRYFWKVTATDGESQSGGDLWHFVTAAAAFTAVPDTLLFPCETDQRTVILTAVGEGPLQWSATSQYPWLDVSPSSGILEGAGQTVWITVVSRAGYSPGSQWGAVHFQGDGFVVPVAVEMEIAPELGGLTPDSLLLTVPSFEDTIMLTNSGCGDLSWDALAGAPWLLALPASGIVHGGGAGMVRVRGDTTGLSIGDHVATLVVNAASTSSLITVTLRVPEGSCLDVVPDSVHIGVAASSAQCVVANCGTGQLTWSVLPQEPWVFVAPSGGVVDPFEVQPVSISVDIAGLPSGLLQTGVWFHGADEPVFLIVTVMVPGIPVLGLSPAQVYLPADTDAAELTIENAGTGILAWSVADRPSWCTVTPAGGVLSQGEIVYPTLIVDRSGVELGPREGVLTVESNGGSGSSGITMDVGVEGCASPVFAADFNDGTAQGWVVEPVGTWIVEDGRYVAGAIPQAQRAWSHHAIDHTGPIRGQVDVWFGAAPSADVAGACALVCAAGFSITIQGVICDAVAASVRPDGSVELQGRAAATGLWTPCGSSGGGTYFEEGWNSLAVVLYATHIGGVLNGEEVAQYQFPVQLRLPPVGAVGLAAWGDGDVAFDRVYVCEELRLFGADGI